MQEIVLTNNTFDIKAIEDKLNDNTKLIILNNPHNPTGKIFTL